MEGLLSWLVLIAAFAVVAGASGIVTAKLWTVGARGRRPPREAAPGVSPSKPPVPEPRLP
jgi:hypothetical protein